MVRKTDLLQILQSHPNFTKLQVLPWSFFMSNVFKWRHFQPVIILQCVRWYLNQLQRSRLYLSHTRNTKAAKRFLSKALKACKYGAPVKINTDQNLAYNQSYAHIEHRKVKYLNNRLESDHGKLRRLIKPMLGFKSMKSANATISGYEVMRMLKKVQLDLLMNAKAVNEAQFINQLFDVYAR